MQSHAQNMKKKLKNLTPDEQAEIILIKIMEAYDRWHHNTNDQVRLNLRELIKTILKQNI